MAVIQEGLRGTGRRKWVVAVLALQFLIPLAALVFSQAPTRLGFQMYSGEGELSGYTVDANGERQPIDVNELLSAGRPDIDWISHLTTDYLCDAYPGAIRVVVTQEYSRGNKTASHTC